MKNILIAYGHFTGSWRLISVDDEVTMDLDGETARYLRDQLSVILGEDPVRESLRKQVYDLREEMRTMRNTNASLRGRLKRYLAKPARGVKGADRHEPEK